MKSRIWILPIEPFEMRYTADWYEWWPKQLSELGWQTTVVDGETASRYCQIEQGEFLDSVKTWHWKGTQVARLANVWPQIQSGDVILILDGWGPATTAALYMRSATRRDVKIVAFMHAGTWDPNDFLTQSGMRPWGQHIEQGWAVGLDLVLVGSDYAARFLAKSCEGSEVRTAVVGCPVYQEPLLGAARPWQDRTRRVVFPHRCAPEKAPEEFERIRRFYEFEYPSDNVEWVYTAKTTNTKAEYYAALGQSRVAVSTAKQETFGIAMQEAAALGCYLVAPFRLSYLETIRLDGKLYSSLDCAVLAIRKGLDAVKPARWDDYHERAIERASVAIEGLFK